MTTLFDATLALAKALGNVRSSVTTGAGAADGTTVIDSTRTEAADYWNDGTLWITSGAKSGNSRKITDWALTGTTFTIPTTTAAAGSGVTYSVLNGDWPQDKLIEFINAALGEYGDTLSSDATLVSVADQESYTLPTGVSGVRRVEIATNSAAPYGFVPHYGWYESGDGSLRFNVGQELGEAGYAIRLWYEARHAALTTDAGVVSDTVNLDRLAWEAAAKAWAWRVMLAGRDRPEYGSNLTWALAKADELRKRYPTRHLAKDPRTTL